MGGHSELSQNQARRIAVAAQGLSSARSSTAASKATIQATFERIKQTQVDSVNVVCRAHYLPMFARLGSYDRDTFDALVSAPKTGITEYWGHEASFVHTDLLGDLIRWRRTRWVDSSHRFTQRQNGLVGPLMEFLEHHPGSTARQISSALQIPAVESRMHWGWNWNDTKIVTEALFAQAQILSLGRNQHFERRYALAQHVVDSRALEQVGGPEDSLRRLLHAALSALGVGTAHCIAEYFRLPVAPVKALLKELAAAGELTSCTVQGVNQPCYLAAGVAVPSRVRRQLRILSPFDSMVFNRQRIKKFFDFEYRIEIYVPREQRRYGYYVFPLLYGSELVGRIDLKADRGQDALRINAVYFEKEPAGLLLEELQQELEHLARWLGLGTVHIGTEHLLCTPSLLALKHQTTA